jgi:hypothetical protein
MWLWINVAMPAHAQIISGIFARNLLVEDDDKPGSTIRLLDHQLQIEYVI